MQCPKCGSVCTELGPNAKRQNYAERGWELEESERILLHFWQLFRDVSSGRGRPSQSTNGPSR